MSMSYTSEALSAVATSEEAKVVPSLAESREQRAESKKHRERATSK
jgi:hypothetical protein